LNRLETRPEGPIYRCFRSLQFWTQIADEIAPRHSLAETPLRFFYLASNQIVKDLNVHNIHPRPKPWISSRHKRSCESLSDAGLESRYKT